MRFRLTYDGPLKATQGRNSDAHTTPDRAKQKHELRQHLHRQLKHLWATDKFLSTVRIERDKRSARVPGSPATWGAADDTYAPMVDVVADRYQEFGYRFVPLVRDEHTLLCAIRVLFLRRDVPGGIIAGDIDNRLKTLVDALRRPQHGNQMIGPPGDGEDPFFVLLEDDRQITHLEVETDTLLDLPTPDDPDMSRVRLVITVEIRPYYVTTDNLSYA